MTSRSFINKVAEKYGDIISKGTLCLFIILAFVGILSDIFHWYLFENLSVFFLFASLSAFFFVFLTKLDQIEKSIANSAEYFSNSSDVIYEMTEMCASAKFIRVVGTKAKTEFIEAINKAIKKPEIIYHRLITSEKISDELKAHALDIIARNPNNVKIKRANMPQCPSFLITDEKVMVILPELESDNFYGIMLSDKTAWAYYYSYFVDLFKKAKEIDPNDKMFCASKCSVD